MFPEADGRLKQALRYLCVGADALCEEMPADRHVPRLSYMTGRYSWDKDYVWDSWANFQWAGFCAGRLWLLHVLTNNERYAEVAAKICDRIGPVLAEHPTVFSSTGIDMYYALTLGYQITGKEHFKQWALDAGSKFANIFDHRVGAFLQIAGADRIVIDTGLNLPSMLWASQWEAGRAVLPLRHLDTVLKVGLVREDGSSCHAAALDPVSREITKLFSLQGWSDDSVWARGQAWAMLDYSHAYEATGDRHYLDVARTAADWYVRHIPNEGVPRYDFFDPDQNKAPYDSCAAAIACAQLMRLSRWLPDRKEAYQAAVCRTLVALIDGFLTVGGVVLHGTWGRMRHAEPGKPRLGRFPQEDVMPYGNYWIAECLFRALSDDWSVLSLNGQP